MPVDRQSRGVPLPTFWQLLMVTVIGCAVYRFSLEISRTADAISEPPGLDLVQELQAVEELASRGAEAVPELLEMLSSNKRSTQRLALHGLGIVGEEASPALEAVRAKTVGEDPVIRGWALTAFVQICRDPDDLWTTTAPFLADPDVRNRDTAASILDGTTTLRIAALPDPSGQRSRPASARDLENLIPSVLAMAHCDLPEIRGEVIRIATRRDQRNDDPAVNDTLRSLLNDSDCDVRIAATAALAARGAARVEEVRAWLRDDDPRVVHAGLDAVHWLGSDGKQALPELLSLMETIPDQHHRNVVGALHALQADAQPTVPAVLRRFKTLDLHLVNVLLDIGATPAELMPMLKSTVAPTHPEFGRQAAEMLARFFPDEARRHAAQLVREIELNEKAVSWRALQTFCWLGPAARDAVPLLIRLTEQEHQTESWIEFYSIEALGCIGPDAAPAVPSLLAALQRPLKEVYSDTWHGNIASSLGQIGPPARSAGPALLDILGEPPPSEEAERRMRRTNAGYLPPFVHVVTALGLIGDDSEQVRSRLRHELEIHSDAQGRSAALHSLIRLCHNSAAVLPDLIRALEDDSSDVRLLAASLGRIEGDRRPAIAGLTKALGDDDPWVASSAALSLREIGPPAVDCGATLRNIMNDLRNRVPNGVRVQRRNMRAGIFTFEPGNHDLSRLSLAEAARLALEAIEPGGP